jgi:hypothetical protein
LLDVLQVGGAILILIAFIAAQRGVMSPQATSYLTLNLVGSALLAYLALHDEDWGFVLLETVWAIVSGWGLIQVLRRDSLRA